MGNEGNKKILEEILFVYIFVLLLSWASFSFMTLFSGIVARWSIGCLPLLFFIIFPIFNNFFRKQDFLEFGITQKNWLNAFLFGILSGFLIVIIYRSASFYEPYATFNNKILALFYWLFLSFSQELFFRGYLQKKLEKILGNNFQSLLISSFLFAFWHLTLRFDPSWFIFMPLFKIFLVSLIWGAIFQKTKNLIAPITSHFITGLGLTNFYYFG